MAENKYITVKGAYFDTINTISSWCSESILNEAMDECQKYNDLLSKTVQGSDIWRVNQAKGKTVTVSKDTIEILKVAQKINEASYGAFNIALGPAVALWHFTGDTAFLPDENKLKAAIKYADCSKIIIKDNTVQVPPKLQIDLGGIAKGYITDQIADFLRQKDIKNAMLNFGGNIVTIGGKPDGSPWRIGLQNPLGVLGKEFWAFVESQDSTVVTSGIYERGFELQGKWYHHILDPRTGWPVQNNLLTVTACTKSSMLADALATAMFIMGVEKGIQLAEMFGVHAIFLEKDGKVTYTNGLNITIVN